MRSFQATAAVAMAAFTLASAQDSSVNLPTTTSSGNGNHNGTPFVKLFIDDGFGGDAAYAGSIVNACADQTVYAVRCTSGPAFVGTATCGPNAPIITITEGPSVYIAAFTTQIEAGGEAVTGTATESCVLAGTTSAACNGALIATAGGESTSIAIQTTISGTDVHHFDVAITAGADKTASATGSCTANGAMSSVDSRGVYVMAVLGALSLAGMLIL